MASHQDLARLDAINRVRSLLARIIQKFFQSPKEAKLTDPRKINSRLLVELVSAGAVLLGLIFVGFELKKNTEAVEAATLQGIIDGSQDYLNLLAADADLNAIWRVANDDPSLLSEAEAARYFFLLRAQWQRYQNAYLQWQRGAMSATDWALDQKFICDPAGSTTGRTKRLLWPDHRPALLGDFVVFVEACWQVDPGEAR